ncbi:MAG: hypothetical protein ABSF54_06110 [Bryobacteraceae bacterium]|jgi:hypothetical protein
MKKALLFVCLLAGVAFAGSNSFTLTLSEPTMIGGTELKAGEYKCVLQDQKIVLKHGHQTTEAAVKVETGQSKYSITTVTYANAGGKNKVEEIQLGGTNMKLVVN